MEIKQLVQNANFRTEDEVLNSIDALKLKVQVNSLCKSLIEVNIYSWFTTYVGMNILAITKHDENFYTVDAENTNNEFKFEIRDSFSGDINFKQIDGVKIIKIRNKHTNYYSNVHLNLVDYKDSNDSYTSVFNSGEFSIGIDKSHNYHQHDHDLLVELFLDTMIEQGLSPFIEQYIGEDGYGFKINTAIGHLPIILNGVFIEFKFSQVHPALSSQYVQLKNFSTSYKKRTRLERIDSFNNHKGTIEVLLSVAEYFTTNTDMILNGEPILDVISSVIDFENKLSYSDLDSTNKENRINYYMQSLFSSLNVNRFLAVTLPKYGQNWSVLFFADDIKVGSFKYDNFITTISISYVRSIEAYILTIENPLEKFNLKYDTLMELSNFAYKYIQKEMDTWSD